MDIREKLVELMKERTGCTYGGSYGDVIIEEEIDIRDEEIVRIADILIANGVTVQEWIPVTERLPKNDYEKPWRERQRYLVRLQGGSMRVATYGYKEDDWWIDSHDCVLHVKHHTAVTHWMLAPQPPKGE